MGKFRSVPPIFLNLQRYVEQFVFFKTQVHLIKTSALLTLKQIKPHDQIPKIINVTSYVNYTVACDTFHSVFFFY